MRLLERAFSPDSFSAGSQVGSLCWVVLINLGVDMSEEVPPFNLKGSRFDQSTFSGRLNHFKQMVDPNTLLTTKAELDAAQDLLARHTQGKATGTSDLQLWEATARRPAAATGVRVQSRRA